MARSNPSRPMAAASDAPSRKMKYPNVPPSDSLIVWISSMGSLASSACTSCWTRGGRQFRRHRGTNLQATLRNGITMLINNAGTASVASLLNADVNKMDEIIALNITALTRLTYAAAPAFVARGNGTIINIGSVVGVSPEALNGVYGASKAYVLAFRHSLQNELADKGIRVQAVLPGATATDLWEIAGLPWQKLPPSIVMPVEDMVDAALVGLDQGELVTIPGLHDGDEWTRFEAACRAISQRFGNSVPARRYRIGEPAQQRV